MAELDIRLLLRYPYIHGQTKFVIDKAYLVMSLETLNS